MNQKQSETVPRTEPPESPPPTQEILARTWEEEQQYQEELQQLRTEAKKQTLPFEENTQSSAKVKKETLPSDVANQIPDSKCPSRRVASGAGKNQHADGEWWSGHGAEGSESARYVRTNRAIASADALLQAFLCKVERTREYQVLKNDVDKESFLRYKELEWRQHRLRRAQGVPDRVTFEKAQKRERPLKGDALNKAMEQGNESDTKCLRRLTKIRDNMDEFINMLSIEGEDCWDEESDNSFEDQVENKLEDMQLERNPLKPFRPPALGV
jgi:hypothetical protein